MSVVVWKGKTIVADTASIGNHVRHRATKIEKLTDGTIVGWVGIWADGKLFAEWLQAGADRSKPPTWCVGGEDKDADFCALVLSPDGRCEYWYDKLVPQPVEEDFMAIGSGCAAATGALCAGCGPETAVEIACQVDSHCSLPIIREMLPD